MLWTLWGISSAGRAPALHAGGQGFEPLILHQPERVSTLKTEYIYFVYKQVNNENEIENNTKSFSKMIRVKITISKINRENQRKERNFH